MAHCAHKNAHGQKVGPDWFKLMLIGKCFFYICSEIKSITIQNWIVLNF